MSAPARTSASRAFGAPPRTAYFPPGPAVELLDALKAEAPEGAPYWRTGDAISFGFGEPSRGTKTSWYSIKVSGAKFGVFVTKQTASGQIMPTTSEGLAELQAQKGPQALGLELRGTRKPCTLFRLYGNELLQTEKDDSFTYRRDAEGNELTPDPASRQLVVRLAIHLNTAFLFEAGGRVLAGQLWSRKCKTKTGEELISVVGAEVEEEYPGFDFQNRPGELIALGAEITAWPPAAKALAKGAIVAPSTKIVELVQHTIRAGKDAGKTLLNPIMRVTLPFDDTTGKAKIPFHDADKPFRNSGGGVDFEPLLVDGAPVDVDNVHKAVVSGSSITGILDAAVCCSNMGISIPASLLHCLIKRPAARGGDRTSAAVLAALSPEDLAEFEAAADARPAAETERSTTPAYTPPHFEASGPSMGGGGAGAAAGGDTAAECSAVDDELLAALSNS